MDRTFRFVITQVTVVIDLALRHRNPSAMELGKHPKMFPPRSSFLTLSFLCQTLQNLVLR